MLGFSVFLIALAVIAAAVAVVRRKAINLTFVLAEVGAVFLLVLATCGSQQKYRKEHLARLNAEATADTQVNWYKGQLQIATRLVLQRPVKVETVFRAAHPVAHVAVAAAPSTIVDSSHGTASGDTLYGVLDARDSAGIRIAAGVVVSRNQWGWLVEREPLPLGIVLSCDHDAARATVSGPRWANLHLGSLEQDPAICNPTHPWQPFSFKPPSLPWVVVIAGVVYFVLGR